MGDPAHEQVTRREIAVVALCTVVAFALRLWDLGGAGLSQFDEGVYAFSGLGLSDSEQPRRLFPEQEKFSPPLYFTLVALSYLFGGARDTSAIAVNVILGALTVPVVWWVARRWVGPTAASGAAVLTALSEVHITLSRSALTDVAFALVFCVALGALVWALERGALWRGVVAGLAIGVAWNTKYHGWFALVIGAMVLAAQWRLQRAPWSVVRGRAVVLILAGVVAGLAYAPWALFIQSQSGSTGGWATYFATMLRIDWPGNLVQYAQQQLMLEGPWSRAAVPAASVAMSLVRRDGGGLGPGPARIILLGVLAIFVGATGSAVVLAIFALWSRWQGRQSLSTGELTAAALMMLWVVMAPLYQPYFRLLLPFLLMAFILGAAGLQALPPDATTERPLSRNATLALGVLVMLLVGATSRAMPDVTSPWRDTRALARAAEAIDARIPPGTAVSVIGEPPLAFYLHRRGHPSFTRATLKSLDEAAGPVYFVSGYYARKADNLSTGLRDRADRLELLGRFPIEPSDLRLLDDARPPAAREYRERPDSMYDLLLFRYTPRAGGIP